MERFAVPVSVRRLSIAALVVSAVYIIIYIAVILLQMSFFPLLGLSEPLFTFPIADVTLKLPVLAAAIIFAAVFARKKSVRFPAPLPAVLLSVLYLCTMLLQLPLVSFENRVRGSEGGAKALASVATLNSLLGMFSWLFVSAVILVIAASSVFCYACAHSSDNDREEKHEQMQ